MIFEFIVRRLRWLRRVPVAPQIFDSLLLTWTALFHRGRMAAMERLETETLRLPGVGPCGHRFGGIGFVHSGHEFAHLHGNGLLDIRLTRKQAGEIVMKGRALPHHVFPASGWVSFWIRSDVDVPAAMDLLRLGMATTPGQ